MNRISFIQILIIIVGRSDQAQFRLLHRELPVQEQLLVLFVKQFSRHPVGEAVLHSYGDKEEEQ